MESFFWNAESFTFNPSEMMTTNLRKLLQLFYKLSSNIYKINGNFNKSLEDMDQNKYMKRGTTLIFSTWGPLIDYSSVLNNI